MAEEENAFQNLSGMEEDGNGTSRIWAYRGKCGGEQTLTGLSNKNLDIGRGGGGTGRSEKQSSQS